MLVFHKPVYGIFLLLTLPCFSQHHPAVDVSKSSLPQVINDPFEKGNFHVEINRLVNFDYLNSYNNDVKYGHTNDFGFNLNATKFYWQDFGIGARLRGSWSEDHGDNFEDLTRRFSFNPYAVYGKPLSSCAGIYLQLGPTIGFRKTIDQTGTQSSSVSSHIFGFDAELGLPLTLGGGMYLIPDICYDYCDEDYPSYTVTRSDFGAGLHIGSYLPCPSYWTYDKPSLWNNYYESGSNFLDFGTKSNFRFGTSTQKIDISGIKNKTDNSDFNFDATYGHYMIPRLAIGLNLTYSNQVQKNDNFKNTVSDFTVSPLVRFNLPFYPNLYLQGQYGWGWDNFTSSSGGNSTTDKLNFTNYGIYAGYNFPMNQHTSWNFQLGYSYEKSKVSGSNYNSTWKGITFGTGLSYSFR